MPYVEFVAAVRHRHHLREKNICGLTVNEMFSSCYKLILDNFHYTSNNWLMYSGVRELKLLPFL